MDDTSLPVAWTLTDWLKPYGISLRDLFRGLAWAMASQSVTEWQKAYDTALEICSIHKAGKHPGDLSFALICRSLVRTVYHWLLEIEHLLTRYSSEEEEDIVGGLDLSYESEFLEIGREFFLDPRSLSILPFIENSLEQWLVAHAVERSKAKACLNRLAPYFVYTLDVEWRRHGEYKAIGHAIDSLFTRGDSDKRFWMSYGFYWDKVIHQPVFGVEPFDVTQVYQPLRAWRHFAADDPRPSPDGGEEIEPESKNVPKLVVDIHQELTEWIENGRDDDRIRMVTGSPGSGLAAFDHMFAHQVMHSGKAKVLVVPLSRFQIGPDLKQSVAEYIGALGPFNQDPFELRDDGLPLLLVLSHLDRLKHEKQGPVECGIDFARSFKAFLRETGDNGRRLPVLLTARPATFEALKKELPNTAVKYTLLPFYVPPDSRSDYRDPQGLLETDQRRSYWAKFCGIMSPEKTSRTSEEEEETIVRLPVTPMLTYMTASSFVGGEREVAQNDGYEAAIQDYIDAAYDRTFDDKRPYRWSHYIDRLSFDRVLDEAAVAVWRGKERAVTVQDLRTRFKETGLSDCYKPFIEQARSGVLGVISIGQNPHHIMSANEDEIVDFQHMSLQYLLAARRIVQELKSLHKGIRDGVKNPFSGLRAEEALVRWVELCGPAWIDHGIFYYLIRLMRSEDKQDVISIQSGICELLNHAIQEGMPVHRLSRGLSFREQISWSRNAEETLLAVHHACAMITERLGALSWSGPMAAGDWIRRVQYQRIGKHNRPALECLTYLDFKDCLLDGLDLWGADLQACDLTRASLQFACLAEANLAKAQLFSADLRECNLKKANLEWIAARQADFREADLRKTVIKEGDLSHADLSRADLRFADLTGVNLSGAKLCGTNLTGANLRWADLRGADFRQAVIDGTDLREAVLDGHELDDAEFRNATGYSK